MGKGEVAEQGDWTTVPRAEEEEEEDLQEEYRGVVPGPTGGTGDTVVEVDPPNGSME